ncbi:MAG: hypothetical protein ACXWJW_13980 [Xanthobacteraceae bacterium]
MRIAVLVTAAIALSIPFAAFADDDISGTYKLVVDQRKIVETGEVIRGPSPFGYISYGKETAACLSSSSGNRGRDRKIPTPSPISSGSNSIAP